MLLSNGGFVGATQLETPWEFVQNESKVAPTTHLKPDAPTNGERTMALAMYPKLLKVLQELWDDLLADRLIVGPSDVHLVSHDTK